VTVQRKWMRYSLVISSSICFWVLAVSSSLSMIFFWENSLLTSMRNSWIPFPLPTKSGRFSLNLIPRTNSTIIIYLGSKPFCSIMTSNFLKTKTAAAITTAPTSLWNQPKKSSHIWRINSSISIFQGIQILWILLFVVFSWALSLWDPWKLLTFQILC